MKNFVDVNLGERSYRIILANSFQIDPNVFGGTGTSVLVVTDSNVDPLYGDAFEEQLVSAGLKPARLVVPAGEKSKDFECLNKVYAKALECGLDRGSSMVALGGGVVGDLTGFAAATYLRGIRFVQVPNTLLAMVDSSVGGKTGVNLKQGKNLVGSFYQPAGVLINLKTLDTLSEEEYACGLAEVVKYGVIYDADLFAGLEEGTERLLERNNEMLAKIVSRCCKIKAEVVGEDEKEAGLRAILNFGHTLGHALENLSGYG
ncbi:3-dehydroquinate synthase, partial [bacterium B17]